ncbi:MAG: sulfurtransferase [Gemmatimonadota bacterium]
MTHRTRNLLSAVVTCLVALLPACAGRSPVAGNRVAPVEGRPGLIATEALGARGAHATILDVRPEWTDYLQNHIPGAAWLNIETLRASDHGLPFQLLPGETYAMLFSRLGVQRDQPVIIYSAGETRDIDATYVAWLLSSLGQSQVSVLDGGFAKWVFEGRRVDQRYPEARVPDFPNRGLAAEIATLTDVRAATESHNVLLVDARNPQQFAGAAGAQIRRGHIPGAVNHPWTTDLEKRDFALVWKTQAELKASYSTQGITADRDIIVYCNTGTEASHVYFALRYLLGYPRVRIYAGAWSEWAAHDEVPVVIGEN